MPAKPKRKLKTYQTSLGFYDQAIAAPSMKAALEAWGASSNLFHQGAAKETDDPDVVAATMAKPGVVLRRPVGSDGAFSESAELPTDLGDDDAEPGSKRKKHPRKQPRRTTRSAKRPAKAAKTSSGKSDEQAVRKAAAAFEKEERRREAARAKEEAARARDRARRDKAVAAAEAALGKARREHDSRTEAIEAERAALDVRAEAEQDRWDKQRIKLQETLRRARE
ncbi:cell envelope biogenesis protein TolA [Bradyrhizobium symbiodeficiens]|uniref:Cell envelope biogenesis protein TolA n=1 Tax=Bradyrhizobium symbiodeficiens TaxID=1404367 RepID=A0A6G9ACN2_9BRAD|nr:cell envelope biogenesis protein TolA [Bradyrhizobium symbiodeficiens]QIP10084.1 cell envelope biogenesis protein TolA [Bradyrhizobium symbiodeficiens]